jgi:hypothetical protein
MLKAADRLEALEAEVARLREATPQWQQIETAPREERVIIAVPCKRAIDGWLIAEAYYRYEDDDEDGWWWANTGPYDVGECRLALSGHHPTHWMPLPPPPEAET